VNQSAPAPEVSSLKGEIRQVEPDRIGRSIARRSAEVRATVPDVEFSTDAAAEAAEAVAAQRQVPLLAVLVLACARALRDRPYANAAYRDGRYELYSRVNIGVTIHSDGAQITPALLDADTKSLDEIAEELQRFHERALAGELTPPELAGTTFTLSDLGDRHVDRHSPLVTPPQAAALATSGVRTVPVVRDGAVIPGRVLALTLACDHRILFGTRAATVLERITELVEEPEP
jgi:pyruvate dehydrogenase E2 component (dihydrolipoamide acetyltransferase)